MPRHSPPAAEKNQFFCNFFSKKMRVDTKSPFKRSIFTVNKKNNTLCGGQKVFLRFMPETVRHCRWETFSA